MTLLSLVDPDNRVPPSWDELGRLIEDVSTTDTQSAFAAELFDLARTVLTERVLRLRKRRPECFGDSSGYEPLVVDGPDADHVVAYTRTESDEDGKDRPGVVVIVTRCRAVALDGAATTVELPTGTWRSLLHDDARLAVGGSTRLADLLSSAEVAVLERTDT